MSGQHPDRDSLSAFLEQALSIDATQWIEHHLETCHACQDKLEEERRFLCRLDGMRKIDSPKDFTEAVMARVAQLPPHQPKIEVPWLKVAISATGLAALIVVLVGIAGWMLIGAAPLESPEASGAASRGVTTFAEVAKEVFFFGQGLFNKGIALAQTAGTFLVGLFELVRRSGLAVQLTILLITVGLNYFFTRLVLNYQRRH